MITENLSTLKIHKLTQEQYDRELEAGRIEGNAIYLTPDKEIDLTPYATIEQVMEKADISHVHDDRYYTETEIDAKLETKVDIDHNHNSLYDAIGSAKSALESAKNYTDEQVAELSTVTSAVTSTVASNTQAIDDIKNGVTIDSFADVESALNGKQSVGDYATKDEVQAVSNSIAEYKDAHTNDYTNAQIDDAIKVVADDVSSLNDIYATDAELNDAITNEVTRANGAYAIKSFETTVTNHVNDADVHTTSADKSLWNTAYNHSQVAHARVDATKTSPSNVNGNIIIDETETNVYSLPAANTSLGGVMSGGDVTITDGIITVTDNSHNHTVNNISDLTATATELNYVEGVTSNIQIQLDDKSSKDHTHLYAGSSEVGGAANSADKLNTSDGSTIQPVYFKDGKPVAIKHTLEKSVPSDAVFTDTHYLSKNVVGTNNSISNTSVALTNGNVYLNSVENGIVTSSHKISGSGATTVETDEQGNIVITSTDNNTTYNAADSSLDSLGLVKSGGDVTISNGIITVNDDSHNHTIENVDNLQPTLDEMNADINNSIVDLSVSGQVITYTKNNGDTGTITTQDTNSDSSVHQYHIPKNIANYDYQVLLSGYASNSPSFNYSYTNDVSKSSDLFYNPVTQTLTVPNIAGTAKKSECDASGNVITETYSEGIRWILNMGNNPSTHLISLTDHKIVVVGAKTSDGITRTFTLSMSESGTIYSSASYDGSYCTYSNDTHDLKFYTSSGAALNVETITTSCVDWNRVIQ